uniref:AAA_14 domain-containing protein n=1 Tax=Strongyloides papillosus TaxID=174720 RepID=A0A0N5BDQ2_STREA
MEIQNVIEKDFDFYGVSLGYQSQVNISIFGLADKTKIITWGVKNSPRAHDDFNHMKAFFKMSRAVYESLHNSQFFAKKEVIFPETSDYLSQFYQWQNDLRQEEVVKKYIGPDRQALVKDFYRSCEYANYSICSENEFLKFPIAKLLLDEVDLLRGTMESNVLRIGQIMTNSRNL